jgi:hypothetical protein
VTHAIRRFAPLLFSLLALVGIASCSGAVSSPPVTPPPPGDPLRIEIQPENATAFSQTPTTFVITGGNGSYIVSSSNQGVLPVSGAIEGNLLTVVPNFVTADTPVTLTVRDTGTATTATASLTVRPRTVSSSLTITPTSTACEPAICAGDDATVEATLTENGVPLVGRPVRFDVISGDVGFITSGAGATTETTATSTITTTDLNGKARVRFRVLSTARSQTALISATDVNGGSFVRTNIFINGAPSAPTVIPQKITVTGPSLGVCPVGSATVDVYIFGGVPPYTISNTQPSSVIVERNTVSASGGFFRIRTVPNLCFTSTIIVSDAVGQRSLVEVEAIEGTTAPVGTGNLVVAPEIVTLDSCQVTASVTVAGGQGSSTYRPPVSSSSNVTATLSGNIITIRRTPGTGATTSPVRVSISDGRSTATVTVELAGPGALGC